MAGSAASESIFFIGAVVVATALVGAFGHVANNLSDGVRGRGSVLAKELQTDITVINDPLGVTTSPLTLYVKNTGSTSLLAAETEILLNGVVSTDITYDVLSSDDDERWRVGEVVEYVVNDLTVDPGDHRVRVIAESGIETTFEFTAV